MKFFLLISIFILSQSLWAEGIDVLLDALNVKEDKASKEDRQEADNLGNSFDLSDPFLVQLFTEWKNQKHLDYDINRWIIKVLRKNFTTAAHLISAIEKKTPSHLSPLFKALEVYLYRQLGLGQTVVNSWISFASNKIFLSHSMGITLSAVLAKDAFDWVMKTAPLLNAEQLAFLESVPASTNNTMNLALKSWASLKRGLHTAPLLDKVPRLHPIKIPMARSVVIAYLKKGDVANAGRILKKHLAPVIRATNDINLMREHYLTIARLLYQVGMLEASEEFYQKIPNDTEDYLKAQTELAWVLLRRGEMGRLKGLLTTLGHNLFIDVFNPEIYLVRSIVNLKLCQYKAVHDDFNAFIANNKRWGKKIIEELKREDPGRPSIDGNDYTALKGQTMMFIRPNRKSSIHDDYYIALYERGLDNLERELSIINDFKEKSLRAALPAVGIQAHWKKAANNIAAAKEHQAKRVSTEYRRFWKNRELVLREAIRKMRFVKVEMMGQLQEVQDIVGFKDGDKVSTVSSALQKKDQQVFPFDGIIWGDEMFRLYTEAESFCLAKRKKS